MESKQCRQLQETNSVHRVLQTIARNTEDTQQYRQLRGINSGQQADNYKELIVDTENYRQLKGTYSGLRAVKKILRNI